MHSLSVVLIITFLFAKEGNDDRSRFMKERRRHRGWPRVETDSQGRSVEAQEKPAPEATPILKAAELPLNGCAGN